MSFFQPKYNIVIFISLFLSVACYAQQQPIEVLAHFDEIPKIVTLPDGRLMAFFIGHGGPGLPKIKDEQDVFARYSSDSGTTWSEETLLTTLPSDAGGFGYYFPLVDHDGEVHLFFLNDRNTGRILPKENQDELPKIGLTSPLDIWHMRSIDNRTKWERPKRIWEGRAGDLQSAIQHSSGRLILPFSYLTKRSWSSRGDGPDKFTYMGKFNCGVLYSDDGGKTWIESPDVLKTPAEDLLTYGPVEPVVVELKDGRVWMLLRTQLGRFYESFSEDGARWSKPTPGTIVSSDSPAGFVRLPDGGLLMFVNSCLRFPYSYGGRHVLHAAISYDEGKTWRGYREILRDPLQKDGPPPTGDNGVSYPYPTLTKDGRIVFTLWVSTGQGRSVYRLSPDWLMQTIQREDFSSGLDNWSTFGTQGVELVPHQKADKKIMRIQKSDPHWNAGAVWNFPAGVKGSLKLKLMLNSRFKGALIGLTNHFSVPFDELAQFYNVFNIPIQSDGTVVNGSTKLEKNRWYELEFNWNCDLNNGQLLLDAIPVKQLHTLYSSPFINYLRIQSTADNVDQGMLIEYVEAKIDN